MENALPPLPDKDFFNMGETARITQVPSHTLRYWEKEVGLLRPARRTSGHRRYSRADIETIFQIKECIERRKMTVEGARRALIESRKGGANDSVEAAVPSAAVKLLREVRKEIDSIVQELR